jgi:nascent polypeptide-associated complex subunit alpha
MIPGLNPRKMQQVMKQLGIQQVEVPASEVIIKTAEKEIHILHPQVSKVNMMGQETFQISGEVREQPNTREVSPEDIQLVCSQTGCSEAEARRALQQTGGDLAEAIVQLTPALS